MKTQEAFDDLKKTETVELIASMPKEERINKASKILSLKDGTSVNSKVQYLTEYCEIEFNEVLEALALAAA